MNITYDYSEKDYGQFPAYSAQFKKVSDFAQAALKEIAFPA